MAGPPETSQGTPGPLGLARWCAQAARPPDRLRVDVDAAVLLCRHVFVWVAAGQEMLQLGPLMVVGDVHARLRWMRNEVDGGPVVE